MTSFLPAEVWTAGSGLSCVALTLSISDINCMDMSISLNVPSHFPTYNFDVANLYDKQVSYDLLDTMGIFVNSVLI